MRTQSIAFSLLFLGCAALVAANTGCGDTTNAGGGNAGGASAGGGDTGGNAPAELNGCTEDAATDMTGMATVDLAWSLPHASCIIVDSGTAVTWTGTFTTHPLKGGETPDADLTSPITTSDQTGASATVTFDSAGEFPYFCNVHLASMQGVIYVH